MPGAIYLKVGIWGTDGGGHLHSKNHPVLYKQQLRMHENCIIVLHVNILTGVAHWLLGPHDTLPCVLMFCNSNYALLKKHTLNKLLLESKW